MIVAATITIVGLLLGITVVERTGLRMSGVLVVPMLAVYTLYSFSALPLFLASALFAYVASGVVRNRTLIYGRQLLLTNLLFGAIVPVAWALGFGSQVGFDESFAAAFFGTIIPGIAAYNYHELDADQRLSDLTVSFGAFVGLLILGAALVNSTVAARLDPAMTAILFTPSSDIAQLRGAVGGNVPITTDFSREFSFLLIAAGVALSEGALARWGVRVGGLIAIPLLVVFSLTNAWVLPVYLLGAAVVFAAITLVNRLTLVYGRVLLALGLAVGMGYAIVVVAFTTTVLGFLLYFTAILSAMGAYNFHRVPPLERAPALAASIGLFALLLAVGRILVVPDPLGLLHTVTAMDVLAVAAALLLGGLAAYDLERTRSDVAEYHSREVTLS